MLAPKRIIIVLLIALLSLLTGWGLWLKHSDSHSDALWQIVSESCLPEQRQHHNPSPCRRVSVAQGYAVLKDRNGLLQFLLLPLEKISGTESPLLLKPETPDFFALAWKARHYMAERLGQPIDERVYSLAINSRWGRTQNQLHIHISCLRPDIRRQLDSLAPTLNQQWQTHQLSGHAYHIRVVADHDPAAVSPFIRIAQELPGARQNMGSYSIAEVAAGPDSKLLLVIKRNWLLLNPGSAEELQDHSCALLTEPGPHLAARQRN